MKKILLIAFVAALLLVPAAAYSANGGTATGTSITAQGTDNMLLYQDAGLFDRDPVSAETITTDVTSEYGFGDIGAPIDQATNPGVFKTYDYIITNEGNASDTYIVTCEITGYGGGASNWAAIVENFSGSLSEGAEDAFDVKVTPSSVALESPNGSYATVVLYVTTDSRPVGSYTGANGNTYGGIGSATDSTDTTIEAAIMTLSRVATVDAPTAYTGDAHDAVPGSVITYRITVSNEGSAASKNVVIVDKVPTNTEGAHMGMSVGNDTLGNVTLTADDPAVTMPWTAYWTSEAAGTVDKSYNGAGWVLLSTPDVLTNEATFVKWQTSEVTASTLGESFTWGVTIK